MRWMNSLNQKSYAIIAKWKIASSSLISESGRVPFPSAVMPKLTMEPRSQKGSKITGTSF